MTQSNSATPITTPTESKRGLSLDQKKLLNLNPSHSPQLTSISNVLISIATTQANHSKANPFHSTKVHSFSPIQRKSDSHLLPSLKASEFQSMKTLVLDLDETLIHSSLSPFTVKADYMLKVDKEKQTKAVYVLIRPHLEDFLRRVALCFDEVVIFTASQAKYANMIIDCIDKGKVVKYRLFREHCTWVNGNYVKELRRLNRSMRNVVIVDNNPNSFCLDGDNGIPIKSFYEDKGDKELLQMTYVLEKLSKVFDVRLVIKEITYLNQINYDKAFELFRQREGGSFNEELLIADVSCKERDSDVNAHSQVKILNIEKVDTKGNIGRAALKIDSAHLAQSPKPKDKAPSKMGDIKGACLTVGNKKVEVKANSLAMSTVKKSSTTRKFFKSFKGSTSTGNSYSNAPIGKKPLLFINSNTYILKKRKDKAMTASETALMSNPPKSSNAPIKKQSITPSALSKTPAVSQEKEQNTYTSLLSLNTKKSNRSTPIATQTLIKPSSPVQTQANLYFKAEKKAIKDIKAESFIYKTTPKEIKAKHCSTHASSMKKPKKTIEIIPNVMRAPEKSTRKQLLPTKGERMDSINLLTSTCSLTIHKSPKRQIRTFGKILFSMKEHIVSPTITHPFKTINLNTMKGKCKSELKIIQIAPTTASKTLKRSKTTTECTSASVLYSNKL